jgi:hypothetical protein
MTVQPTEQCVQTDFTICTSPPPAICASAFFTIPKAPEAASAAPPAVKPDRLRNVRRSIALPTTPVKARDKRGPFATPFVFLVSIDLSFTFAVLRSQLRPPD